MLLYLLRHAEAEDHEKDALRPLSPAGRKSLARLTRLLKTQRLLEPLPLWHSPLVRAVETTEAFVEGLGWRKAVYKSCPGLLPEDDPAHFFQALRSVEHDCLLVGHEPHLSTLTTLLLTQKKEPQVVKIKKSALLCLERKGGKSTGLWRLRWSLSPEFFEAVDTEV